MESTAETLMWPAETKQLLADLNRETTDMIMHIERLDAAYERASLDHGCAVWADRIAEARDGLQARYDKHCAIICDIVGERNFLDGNFGTFTAEQAAEQAYQPEPAKATKATTVKAKRTRPTLRSDIPLKTIRAVRHAHEVDGATQAELARRFKIPKSTVSNIIRRASWFSTVE